ncbi:MAG: RDD family protein [Ferruginibacter sp.]
MQTEQSTTNLLDFESSLIRASTGKRFANYLVDVIVFYILFFVVSIIIGLVSRSTLEAMSEDDGGIGLLDRLISIVLYAVYMGIMEAVFKGKSIGKFITGTRAVNLDGTPISTGKAFARGFSRAVPFCVFSAFGNPCDPWQDRWTDTMVIDEKLSEIN